MSITNPFGSNFLDPLMGATKIPGQPVGPFGVAITPGVSQGTINGTISGTPPAGPPSPTPAPTPTPTAPPQTQPPAQSGQVPEQTGQPAVNNGASNPYALSQVVGAIQNNVNTSNSLVNAKNLVLKQLYDVPLTDAEKATLDPGLKSVIESGDRNLIDFNLRLLNDQIAGRTNTVDQSIQTLTSGYNTAVQQAETAKQNAITNVLNYAKSNGQKPSVILNALYPQLAATLGPQLDKIAAPYGQYIPLAGQQGTAGYDLSSYATNPQYSQEISKLTTSIGSITDASQAQNYISNRAPNSPITGDMVMQAAQQYGVDPTVILAIMTQETQLGTDGSKGATQNNFGNVGNNDTLMASGGSVAKPDAQSGVDAVAKWLSTHKAAGNIDASAPSGPTANVIDATTGLSPNGLYAAALQYASTGNMPSLGLGSAPQTKNARQQIISKAGAILAASGGSIAGNKAAITANSQALAQQTTYYNTIQRSINTVDSNLKILQDAASHVNDSSAPIINQVTNDIKTQTGDGSLNAFKAAIQTVRSEYSNILARGGQVTDTVRGEAQTLIPDNISLDQLNQVIGVLQAEAANVLQSAEQQTSHIQSNLNNIVQANSTAPGASGANNDPLGIR